MLTDALSSAAAKLVRAGTDTPGLRITLVPVTVPPGRVAYKGAMPMRMRWLHPDAARAYAAIADAVVVSDMYRSADSSLSAMQKKTGVLPPGFSRHGYGLAIDVSVSESMKLAGCKTKALFDAWMIARGWHCHRIDFAMKSEAWHYNFLASWPWRKGEPSTRAAGERQLSDLFGRSWQMDVKGEQLALTRVAMYRGAIDGKPGPLTLEARGAFYRAWLLKSTTPRAMYLRTLAFVAADLVTPGGKHIIPALGVQP